MPSTAVGEDAILPDDEVHDAQADRDRRLRADHLSGDLKGHAVRGGAVTLAGLGARRIFYPSSVFVDEPPSEMGEYAAAKGAGEIAGKYLERCYPGVAVYCPRLPRMRTDQTASLVSAGGLDPASVMLEHLRAFAKSAT